MEWFTETLYVETEGKGLHEITGEVKEAIKRNVLEEGQVSLFIQHTSASIVITENSDPTARMDLEMFLDKLAKEGEPWYRHTFEGEDDSPSHMRSILTSTSEVIPIMKSKMCLGRWQGVYLFEHRKRPHKRTIIMSFLKAK